MVSLRHTAVRAIVWPELWGAQQSNALNTNSIENKVKKCEGALRELRLLLGYTYLLRESSSNPLIFGSGAIYPQPEQNDFVMPNRGVADINSTCQTIVNGVTQRTWYHRDLPLVHKMYSCSAIISGTCEVLGLYTRPPDCYHVEIRLNA